MNMLENLLSNIVTFISSSLISTSSNIEDILLNMSTKKKPFIVLVQELWIFHQIPGFFFSESAVSCGQLILGGLDKILDCL